jgi:cytochrome c-type biogenesis protein CcmE
MVGIIVLGAVGFLLVKGLGSSLDYFKTVPQALDSKHQVGTSVFRLEGTVVAGTVQRNLNGATFDVSGGGSTVHVINAGSPPQLFKDDMPVVAVGHFESPTSRTFLSDQIMVKHTATYIAKHPDRVAAKDGSKN